jgi:hypothetical protein
MKNKLFYLIIGVFAAVLAITSCETADKDLEWGISMIIYAPGHFRFLFSAT